MNDQESAEQRQHIASGSANVEKQGYSNLSPVYYRQSSDPAYELKTPRSLRTIKKMPTISRLQSVRSEEHHRFACYCEALGDVPIGTFA